MSWCRVEESQSCQERHRSFGAIMGDADPLDVVVDEIVSGEST